MAVTTRRRYPLSSVEGRAIPTDVLGPEAYIQKSFTTTPPVAVTALPTGSIVAEIRADQDCLISFAALATVPADATALSDAYFLFAGTTRIIEITDAANFSVVGNSAAGTLRMNIVRKYAALAIEAQIARG